MARWCARTILTVVPAVEVAAPAVVEGEVEVVEEVGLVNHGKCDLSIKKRADARAPAMSF